ncbi:DNA invertase Pin-like site-specific DNA recombinase [Pseudarthrobacter sp. PvP004]|nr:DNA invertase Pin-like site-specific DNA recombinase [Pseudarthrobacter sp. PvP004]
MMGPKRYIRLMLVGYARVSTNTQDPTAQRDALAAAGVDPDAIYVDNRHPARTARSW